MKEEKKSRSRKRLFAAGICVALLLVCSSAAPTIKKQRVTSTDYSFFLDRLNENAVTKAEISQSVINFDVRSSDGSVTSYSTPKLDDPMLVQRLYETDGVTFTGISETDSPARGLLFSWVLPILFMVCIWGLVIKGMNRKIGGVGSSVSLGKSSAKVYVRTQTGRTFADVAGQDEAKESLEEIVGFLHDPDKYSRIGASLPKGALLVGPPGTGKTLLAQAVAGEADVPFFSISGSEFVEMFVGMGAAKVRDLFRQANEKAPCIIFIDEIDAIGKKRDGHLNGNDEREQTLNQLLTEMDGFDGRKGIVILAATNRPDSLDPALLRPGRFDRRIPVELPDLAGREAVLRVHAAGIRTESNIDFNSVARTTAGASGAELANIMNEAALRAVRSGHELVTQEDIEESVEVVIAGQQRKSAVISPKEKEIIAYHEIGHALVAAMQDDAAPVHKITIIPRTSGALGYTMQIDEGERLLITREQANARLAVLAGGRSAEEIVFGSFTTGASNDIEKATQLARSMVTRYGMSDAFDMVALETVGDRYLGGEASLSCSPATAAAVDSEVAGMIRSAHEKAREILTANLQKLHELALFLLEKETITGEEFMSILNGDPASA